MGIWNGRGGSKEGGEGNVQLLTYSPPSIVHTCTIVAPSASRATLPLENVISLEEKAFKKLRCGC